MAKMGAPAGITCQCGKTATTVHDMVSESGYTFGQVWACDDHPVSAGAVFEFPGSGDMTELIEEQEEA